MEPENENETDEEQPVEEAKPVPGSPQYFEPWSTEYERYCHDNGSSYGRCIDGRTVAGNGLAMTIDVVHADGHVAPDFPHERVVACVNFLAGVPDEALDRATPEAQMFLALLRGDDTAALVYADEVQARANAGKDYVPRSLLEEEVRALRERNAALVKMLQAEQTTRKKFLWFDEEYPPLPPSGPILHDPIT